MPRVRRHEEGLPPVSGASFPDVEIDVLVGKTITSVWMSAERDVLGFACSDGEHYALGHDQDCCETVVLEEVIGNVADLVTAPILMAEKSTNDNGDESWTFYKLATGKGYVTLRWCGRTSSQYSLEVSFKRVK